MLYCLYYIIPPHICMLTTFGHKVTWQSCWHRISSSTLVIVLINESPSMAQPYSSLHSTSLFMITIACFKALLWSFLSGCFSSLCAWVTTDATKNEENKALKTNDISEISYDCRGCTCRILLCHIFFCYLFVRRYQRVHEHQYSIDNRVYLFGRSTTCQHYYKTFNIKDVSHVQKRKEHHVCLDSRGTALASDLVICCKKKPEMSFLSFCLTLLYICYSHLRGHISYSSK